ncbi:MAG: TetR/AcrR family transcriptional regulator [Alphaproteobacteria bacterium]|jgi:AcrR family transcriptional regulator
MSRPTPDTRTRILDSAWKMLESGTEVRMADIAKSAGISRQALYLHFPARAELLIATTRHIDEKKNIEARLASSRNAETGIDRLNAYIEAWGNYIPEIHGVARALMALQDSDAAAKLAWEDRMHAVREGCEAAIKALRNDGVLSSDYTISKATDILWAMLSVGQWELLTVTCGWSQSQYIKLTKVIACRTLLNQQTYQMSRN